MTLVYTYFFFRLASLYPHTDWGSLSVSVGGMHSKRFQSVERTIFVKQRPFFSSDDVEKFMAEMIKRL